MSAKHLASTGTGYATTRGTSFSPPLVLDKLDDVADQRLVHWRDAVLDEEELHLVRGGGVGVVSQDARDALVLGVQLGV
eukprot:CAMPEP_0195082030 /NCGR_PEP_ID=MMETSP0448-20130528/23319_1 /TAXON_ID=66468 /ORGANISM="Heterocapsa triquestra, Strain CCMP 448" /LENGTH=78 /DNA_ID=CAMNT_0040115097 /DNA_START=168 /DNA_END=401 /DNA_ORIENTATION=+